MKTPLIKAYSNGIARENTASVLKDATLNRAKSAESTTKSTRTDKNTALRSRYSAVDPNKIITKNERDFFINMFPENAEQIEKHVLFNRNGKTASPDIYKGTIVDGRI